MARQLPLTLKLEIERVDLLYRLNFSGVFALLLYSAAHAYVCGSVMSIYMLAGWIFLVVLTSALRIGASLRWRKIKSTVSTLDQVKRWHRVIQALLGLSGIVWGIAGWMSQYSQNATQQMFTAMTLTFMAAGSLVCWAVSLPAMLLIVLPTVLPWSVGFFISQNSDLTFMGVLALIYLALGVKVSIVLNRFVMNSFKLSIANDSLSAELKQEIAVKNQAEESLHLALASSDAMGWSWDCQQDVFICSGDLRSSLGLDFNFFSGTLDEFLQLVVPEDRNKLHTLMHTLILQGGAVDADVRVQLGDQPVRDLAFRGRVIANLHNQFNNVSGIAWNATARKSQARLQQERDVFDAANKAKSVFLANASHEMRTPLAAIEGYAETLLHNFNEGPVDENQMRADLQAITRNGKFLASLMNDFLDLSKIETSRYYIEKSAICLKNEINEAIRLVSAVAEKKNLRLETAFSEALPAWVETDPLRLRQILVNLLSNAVKFTRQGSITVTARYDRSYIIIVVRDTGMGMDESTRTGLFEPFTRGNSADVQKERGSGLGLALSRKLAQLLGGTLNLVSSDPGIGSEFELKIWAPLVKDPGAATENRAEIKKLKPLDSVRLLVVDDDDDLRELMQRFLLRNGAIVETCTNGEEAISKALEGGYAAILMDMKMPVVDGYEATRQLRARGYNRSIIAVSAHANAEEKAKSLKAGCSHYLSKPVDFVALLNVLVDAVKH